MIDGRRVLSTRPTRHPSPAPVKALASSARTSPWTFVSGTGPGHSSPGRRWGSARALVERGGAARPERGDARPQRGAACATPPPRSAAPTVWRRERWPPTSPTPRSAHVVAAATDDLDVGLFVYNATVATAGAVPRRAARRPPLERHRELQPPRSCSRNLLGPPMCDRGRGGIVLVSSMGGTQGSVNFGTYNAGKAFEWVLAETLWAELRERGVDATTILVGPTTSRELPGVPGDARPGAVRAGRLEQPARPCPQPAGQPVDARGGRRRALRPARRRPGVLLAPRRRVHLAGDVRAPACRGRRRVDGRPGDLDPPPGPGRPLTAGRRRLGVGRPITRRTRVLIDTPIRENGAVASPARPPSPGS